MEPPDLCLVMEYMPKGSLYQLLHNQYDLPFDPDYSVLTVIGRSVQLNWPIIRKILLGAAKGMAYLHGCEPIVIHRDLKVRIALNLAELKIRLLISITRSPITS